LIQPYYGIDTMKPERKFPRATVDIIIEMDSAIVLIEKQG
jgi:hypothetical protein